MYGEKDKKETEGITRRILQYTIAIFQLLHLLYEGFNPFPIIDLTKTLLSDNCELHLLTATKNKPTTICSG